ncbi:MAG: type II toxin-antitoxin system VapC family toxin [Actinobacteria bacterium]|nr:type II toxin-antitoxin system VapC family toxin [Actinomycetota bacterium]
MQYQGISCVLDIDIIIDYLRKFEYAWSLLDRWSRQGLLAISTLTHVEIYQGMRPNEKETTQLLLDGLTSIPLDVSIARRAGSLLFNLRSQGLTIGIADAIIGATAITLSVPLITNNIEHYPFSDLLVAKGKED